MLYDAIFAWMVMHRRDPHFLADRCGISPDRLRDLACGKADPNDDEVAALAAAIGRPASELRSAIASSPAAAVDDPLQCLTIREAAVLLHVGRDRVDALVESGQLATVALGERTIRIPRWAIAEMEMRVAGQGRVTKWSAPPHSGAAPPPPRDPPGPYADDPPTGRPRLL